MYCIKVSEVEAMAEETIQERQRLFEDALPDWERRIRKVAEYTLPRIDQGLMDVEDLCQEFRSAVWEASLAFKNDRRLAFSSWIFYIINQASSHLAHTTYYNMPHAGGHIVQLNSLSQPETDPDGYCIPQSIDDPDSTGRIEIGLLTDECVEFIRPVMNEGFEQEVFDMMIIDKLPGAVIAKRLNTADARVSCVRTKIKIAYVLIHGLPIEQASKSKAADSLADRIRRMLFSLQEKINPPEACCQILST